jgi:ABC-type glutathione transport system ATPase component
VRALVKEILERLGMAAEASGIGSLITSHTLEFHANAADADADTETEEGQEEQAT